MRVFAVLAVLLAAGLGAPTAAQSSPPLETARVQIKWPSERSFAAGERVSVKVVSRRHPARVALVRTTARGHVMRTVARRTLRDGTLRATLSKLGRYALRVTVGGRRWQREITVSCARMTGDRAELRVATATVRAGEALPYEVVNASTGCITIGVGYAFERLQPDGTWAPVLPYGIFPALGIKLSPGTAYAKRATVPADAPPGSYRLLDDAFGAPARINLVAPFEVVP